jgi:hypothetical protein
MNVHPETAVALEFSESMAASTVATAFEVVEMGQGGGPVSLLPTALVAEGRLLVLLPSTDLEPGSAYNVRMVQNAVVTDLNGSQLSVGMDRVVGSFTVANTAPATPVLVTSFPRSQTNGQGTTTSIAVVFDRPIDPATINTSSFAVTVDGATPAFNPLPDPYTFIGTGGVPTDDTRLFVYRSVDNEGDPVAFPVEGMVEVNLSPVGNQIRSIDGGTLANSRVEFSVAPIGTPLAARIVSAPTDAIGIANIDGTQPLMLEVDLLDGQEGDRLGVFWFGTVPNSNPPRLGSLFREFTLPAAATTVQLDEEDLDLASSTSPPEGRFEDGELALAVSHRRGADTSAVRRLDVDGEIADLQDPILDLTAPMLLGLGPSGSQVAEFRSDLGGLSLVGRASEQLRAVSVIAAFANNDPQPPVVGEGPALLPPVAGSSPAGFFVARPAGSGVIEHALLPVAFDVTLFDRALNQGTSVSASFTQLGAVSPSANVPVGMFLVEAFDAQTLAPVAGATVYVHDRSGSSIAFVVRATTQADGTAFLTAATSAEPVITVDAGGYDLFTLYNASPRVGVPLERTSPQTAGLGGQVSAPDDEFNNDMRLVADSRQDPLAGLSPVSTCSFNGPTGRFFCSFSGISVLSDLLGSTGFVAVRFPQDEQDFSAASFLLGHGLLVPSGPAEEGMSSMETVETRGMLEGLENEAGAIDGNPDEDPTALSTAGTGLGTTAAGFPQIRVEGRVPGLRSTALIGLGAAFVPNGNPGDLWDVRWAFPGSADFTADSGDDELGKLVTSGTIEDDLLLRCTVEDTEGNVAGIREERGSVGATLTALAIPNVQSPGAGSNSGSGSYSIVFDDVLAGSGMFRASLRDSAGRGWKLHRADDSSNPTTELPLPVDLGGGSFLTDGPIDLSVSAFALPSFTPANFLWSDIERDHTGFAHSREITFTQP